MADLDHLDRVLRAADEAHADDVASLADMDEGQIAYLANAGEIEDPLTDGVEGRCPV